MRRAALFSSFIKLSFLAFSLMVMMPRASHAQSVPAGLALEGVIFTAAGIPEESSSVSFTIQIKSPGTESCMLYQETQTLNMSNSGGTFAFTIGQGVRPSSGFEATSSLRTTFNNIPTTLSGLTCQTGNTYTPMPGDKRSLVMTFNDGSGSQTVTQAMDTESVPYALFADSIQGKLPGDFINVNSSTAALTQANLEGVFNNPSSVTALEALIAGSSSLYAKSSASGGVSIPTYAGTPAAPTKGSVWFNTGSNTLNFFDGTATQTVGTSGGSVTSITAGSGLSGGTITSSGTISMPAVGAAGTYAKVTTDAQGRVSSGSSLTATDIPNLDASIITTGTFASGLIPSGTDSTKLPLAGGTMTGAIAMAGKNITNTGVITQQALTYLQLGRYTDLAEPTLIGSLNPAFAGATWYNTTSNQIKYWNGTTTSVLATGSTAIASLNGLTTATQTFASGTSGTAPAFNSSGSTHTLNIPMASVAGTTAGLLANTDYASLVKANGTVPFTAAESMGGFKLTNVADPTLLQDAATKNYSDSNLAGKSLATSVATAVTNSAGNGFVLTWNQASTSWQAAAPATSGTVTALTGDVTASGSGSVPATVAAVGTSSAANVHSAEIAANAATSSNTVGMIIKRDVGGNFTAGTASLTSANLSTLVLNDSGTHTVTLQAPTTVTGSYALKLPPADGTANQVLKTDGAGTLGWASGATGTVTNIATGTGLTGGPITSSGTISLASIGANTLLANATGAGATPIATSISSVIDGAIGSTQGSVLYRSGTAWTALTPGTAGQFLSSGGAAANPSWASGATGTVTSVTGTAPISVATGTTTPVISIATANTTTTGAISSTDWNTFNLKLSPTLTSANIYVGNASSVATSVAMSGDATLSNSGSLTVATVGTSAAASIHSAELAANAATSLNTVSKIVARDSSGNFIANVSTVNGLSLNNAGSILNITNPIGGAWNMTLPATAGSSGQVLSTNGSGILSWASASAGSITALTGDVTASGTGSVAATVATVGTSTATNVHNAELLANAATNLNTASTLVKRDPSGNFSAGAISDSSVIYRDGASNTVTVQAPTTVTTSYVLKLPPATGTANQAMITDGSGNLSWSSILSPTLSSANIYVGNASSVATSVAMSGDATLSNSGALAVATVGTSTATNIHSAELAANAATPINTVSKIVARDSSGNFIANVPTVNGLSLNNAGSILNITNPIGGAWNMTLPATAGSSGQVLSTNGLGVLSWATPLTNASGFINGGNSFGAGSSIGNNDSYDLSVKTNNATRMTIQAGGNVGIGTTAPSRLLHLSGSTDSVGLKIQNTQAGGGSYELQSTGSGDFTGVGALGIFDGTDYYYVLKNGKTTIGGGYPPTQPLSVTSGVSGSPATSGSAQSAGLFRVYTQGTGLDMGSFNTHDFWMQVADTGSLGTTRKLALNPNGGNVGIGTSTPGASLDVKGAIRMSGATSGYTGFQPAAAAGSTVWTLPIADGTSGQTLATNGSGTLSWSGVPKVVATYTIDATASSAGNTFLLNPAPAGLYRFVIGAYNSVPASSGSGCTMSVMYGFSNILNGNQTTSSLINLSGVNKTSAATSEVVYHVDATYGLYIVLARSAGTCAGDKYHIGVTLEQLMLY